VQHGGFDHLDHVRAIQRRAAVARIGGGETDLVVDDDVHRAARVVTTGLGQRQRLHHHTLAGEGGIAVHLHGQHLIAFLVAAAVLTGPHRALHHRVDDLQVRRVERQRQVNRAARRRHIGREALVVLHVARRQVLGGGVFKLGEQILGLFAQGVDQHIEATPVGHANHKLLHAAFATALDQFIHGRDEAFATFQ